jgi:hypothetical protein
MKQSHDPLQRLFRAAALASKEMPAAPPAALENRVMARWRNAGIEDEFDLFATLLRRAVVFASLIMVLSIGWGWMQSRSENASETTLANYAMNIQLPP